MSKKNKKKEHHKFKKITSIFLVLVFSFCIFSCGIPIIAKYAFSVSSNEDNKATAKIYYKITPKAEYGIVPAPKLYFLYTVKDTSSNNSVAITDSIISSYFKSKFNNKPTNIGTAISSGCKGFMFYKASSAKKYSSSNVKDIFDTDNLSEIFSKLDNNSKYDKPSTIGVYFNIDNNKQQTLPIEFNKEITYECTLDQQDITKKEYTIKVKTTNGINSNLSVFLHDFKGSKFTLDCLQSLDYSLMDNRINNTIIEVYAVVCSGNEGASSTNISYSDVFKIAKFDLKK